jgi:hypothetical protein
MGCFAFYGNDKEGKSKKMGSSIVTSMSLTLLDLYSSTL